MAIALSHFGGNVKNISSQWDPKSASSCFTELSQGYITEDYRFRFRFGLENVAKIPLVANAPDPRIKLFNVGAYIVVAQLNALNQLYVTVINSITRAFVGPQNRLISYLGKIPKWNFDCLLIVGYGGGSGVTDPQLGFEYIMLVGSYILLAATIAATVGVTNVIQLIYRDPASNIDKVFTSPRTLSFIGSTITFTYSVITTALSAGAASIETQPTEFVGRIVSCTLKRTGSSGSFPQLKIDAKGLEYSIAQATGERFYTSIAAAATVFIHSTAGMRQILFGDDEDIISGTLSNRLVSAYKGDPIDMQVMSGSVVHSISASRGRLKDIRSIPDERSVYPTDTTANPFADEFAGTPKQSIYWGKNGLGLVAYSQKIYAMRLHSIESTVTTSTTTYIDAEKSGFEQLGGCTIINNIPYFSGIIAGNIEIFTESTTSLDYATSTFTRHSLILARFPSLGSQSDGKVMLISPANMPIALYEDGGWKPVLVGNKKEPLDIIRKYGKNAPSSWDMKDIEYAAKPTYDFIFSADYKDEELLMIGLFSGVLHTVIP